MIIERLLNFIRGGYDNSFDVIIEITLHRNYIHLAQ